MGRFDTVCDGQVIRTMIFLLANGPSKKTEIYDAVARNQNMPKRLERMREAGLVDIVEYGPTETVTLTATGVEVARLLQGISDVLADA